MPTNVRIFWFLIGLILVGGVGYLVFGPDRSQAPQATSAPSAAPAPSASQTPAPEPSAATEAPAAQALTEAPKDVQTDAASGSNDAASANTSSASNAPATPTVVAIVPPSFDVVRVDPVTGDLLVAGRAEPESGVTLLADGRALDTVQASKGGEFVILPMGLKPGSHDLSLSMKLADGRAAASMQSVTIEIPANKAEPTIVAKIEPGKPTELLAPIETAPTDAPAVDAQPAVTPPKAAEQTVSNNPPPPAASPRPNAMIAIVEAEDTGTLFASGSAAEGATIRLYLNDAYLAEAQVGADKKWSLMIAHGVIPGQYLVRVDDVNPATGAVLTRAEVPFDFQPKIADLKPATAASGQTEPSQDVVAGGGETASTVGQVTSTTGSTATPSASTPAPSAKVVIDWIGATTVTRGDNLWKISKKAYGSGYRFVVIHKANRTQIRNPSLIYPGQVLVLPHP